MAGHKISDVDRAYWYMDPEYLKKRYLKAMPYLSIDQVKIKTISDENYKKVEEMQKVQEQMKNDMLNTKKLFKRVKEYPELMVIIKQIANK